MKLNRVVLAVGFFVAVGVCALPAMASVEGDFNRTLTVSGPVNLDVETGSGSITVRNGASGQVQVHGHIKVNDWFGGSDAEDRLKRLIANPPIQQSGSILKIGHIDDPDL